MGQQKQEGDDEQAVHSILGRLLSSQDNVKKPAKVLPGGEKGRILFSKLMMQGPSILIVDEPTNHLDMESVESLNMALRLYQDTLVFVSCDCGFVGSLATRILEITPERAIDFSGNYKDYLHSKGIEQVIINSPDVIRATGTDGKRKIAWCATFIRPDSVPQYIEFS